MTLEEKIKKLTIYNDSDGNKVVGKLTIVPNFNAFDVNDSLFLLVFNPTNHEDPMRPRFIETWDDNIESGVDQLLKDCETINWGEIPNETEN